MNHKRKSRLSGSYVALTKVPEPGNERDSTILSAPLGDGCLRTAIVDRERAGALRHHSALRPAGCSRRRGAFPSDRTCAAWYSNRISPAIHRISNFEVIMTCVDSPVAGSTFREKAVLLDEWKGAGVAGIWTWGGRRVFMEMNCPFFCPDQRDMTAQDICGGLTR